jgi:hypothetical protein
MPVIFSASSKSRDPRQAVGSVIRPTTLKLAPNVGEQVTDDWLHVPRMVLTVEWRLAEGRVFVTLQDLKMPTSDDAQALLNMLVEKGTTLAHNN